MRYSGGLVRLVIAGLLLAACSPVVAPPTLVPDSATEAVAPSLANADQWDELVSVWLEAEESFLCDAPGGVLLVDSPEGRYEKTVGAASKGGGRLMSFDDRFEIGSNTKSFTVALALQLQEEGVWTLDDPLSMWLPEWAARIPNGKDVTLRQMAGNISGIWDYADPLMQPLVDSNDQEGLAQGYTPEELIGYAIENGQPDFAPGTDWNYSSTNFILLGMAVEAATGESLPTLLQERIFDRLGMGDTSYLEGVPAPDAIVDGYYTILETGEIINVTGWNATQGGAAGAIVSTAEDMTRYARGLMNEGILQNAQSFDEMFDFRELDIMKGGGVMEGYGLGIIAYATQGFDAWGHAGQTPGFQSVWFYVPEADTSVVFLANSGTCMAGLLPVTLSADMFGLDME